MRQWLPRVLRLSQHFNTALPNIKIKIKSLLYFVAIILFIYFLSFNIKHITFFNIKDFRHDKSYAMQVTGSPSRAGIDEGHQITALSSIRPMEMQFLRMIIRYLGDETGHYSFNAGKVDLSQDCPKYM